jgi:hypothetical protein
MSRRHLETSQDYLQSYPRICGHLICESLGYATPSKAALILRDAHERKPNYCEWIDACYNREPLIPVRNSIRNRHSHHGYMSEYTMARALVKRAIASGDEPLFASWF